MERSASSDDVAYEYDPLPGRDYIRLMHVEPALYAYAPIRFLFQTVQLFKIIAQYEAISYTWGEPRRIHPLYIDDGTCVLVTKNLDKALRRLRHPTTVRLLWADAVCINQIDNDEKSGQIPLMARIFRRASKVLAWLDGGVDEERGMMLFEQLSRYHISEDKNEEPEYQRRQAHDSSLREEDILIHKFLSLSWFTRLWIVQEIVMNADIELICGTSSITWLRFTVALEYYLQNFHMDRSFMHSLRFAALQTIAGLWYKHSDVGILRTRKTLSSTYTNILDLVDTFQDHGCSDPRDRIFALYNMTEDIQPCNYQGNMPCVRMDVKYSSSIQEVYQNFASACIERSHPVLDAVIARQYSPRSYEGWPSWVPDWRMPPSNKIRRPWTTRGIGCHNVAQNIVGLQPLLEDRSHPEKFYVINHIFTPPDTTGGSMNLLVELCRNWPHLTLLDLVSASLPHRSEHECRDFTEHIIMVCEAHPTHNTSTQLLRYIEISSDLQATMRHHRFFSATKSTRMIGYGNAAMAKGDKILRLDSKFDSISGQKYQDALLLRPYAKRTGIIDVDIATHKLIGSCVITNPQRDFMVTIPRAFDSRVFIE
jgi:hypothetical protein